MTLVSKQSLSVEYFTDSPRVIKCIEKLEAFQKTKPLVVSDVLDNDGHQYVNLVQKGGGVLGIALVGYTYILEHAGIRFLRLAGTSAGAINTALMAVIDNKNDPKSKKIIDNIRQLDFFKLVDGHPFARMLIRKFISSKNFIRQIKFFIFIFIGILVALLTSDIALKGLETARPKLHNITLVAFVLTGFYLVIFAAVLFYMISLLRRLKNAGFGINPGDYFYTWLKDRMHENGVDTVSQLKNKANQPIPGLHMRSPRNDDISDLTGDVTFIASELVSKNKIQLPEMCDLFRPDSRIDELQPAGFVRASMSIPLFFESYFINDIPTEDRQVKKAWKDRFEIEKPPHSARFVDGGILSNFPFSIFYKPNIEKARLPTFGIDLDDSTMPNKSEDPANWSLDGYLGRMFNTIRYYYDKDFLLKNKVFEKGIGKIPLSGFNWLNFFIKDEEKKEMFARGAEAATCFLMKFDWGKYMSDRDDFQKGQHK